MIGVFEVKSERENGAKIFYSEQMQETHRRFDLLLKHEFQTYGLFTSALATHPQLIEGLANEDILLVSQFIHGTVKGSNAHQAIENLWIHIVDASMHSFYRSWSFKRGDDLTRVRPDLLPLVTKPRPLAQISLGIYALSMKHTHPIYKGDKLLGFIEIITPLQDILKRFSHDNSIQSALVVDAKDATKVTQSPYSDLDDHYSILYTTSPENIERLQGIPFDSLCGKDKFLAHDEALLGVQCLEGYTGKRVGYAVFFLTKDVVDEQLRQSLAPLSKLILVLVLASALLFLLFIGYARAARLEFRSVQNLYDRLIKESNTDALTSLPNRRAIRADMQTIPYQHVLLLNIDSFRMVNDFYGADFGDELLIEFAKRLRMIEEKHQGIKAYRLHADEFALLAPEEIELSRIIKITLRFMTQYPYDQNSHNVEIALSLSMGVAERSPRALEQADIALKLAKNSSDTYKIYAPSFENHHQLSQHITLTRQLKEALKEDRIVPFFQPIVDSCGVIQKYECLARLIEADGSIIPPFLFLQIAKKSKLYPKVTRRIIQKSFQAMELKSCDFSINLSFEDIANPKTRDFIIKTLQLYSGRNRVIFEIVETENINNYKLLEEFINEVKLYGARIAIDDFGSGYSNFLNLIKLQADFIKIDGSLIKELGRDTNVESVVRSIIAVSKELGIGTIAEFVDSEFLSKRVADLGIDFQQGYHFYKPAPQLIPAEATR